MLKREFTDEQNFRNLGHIVRTFYDNLSPSYEAKREVFIQKVDNSNLVNRKPRMSSHLYVTSQKLSAEN